MKAHLATRAVHAGRNDLTDRGLHTAPVDLSTTYPSRDLRTETDRLEAFAAGELPDSTPIYGRIGNPTVRRFEEALADLEGSADAVAFGSGMAALSACLLARVAEGLPHVVAVRPLYGTSDHLLQSGLLGTRVTWSTPETVAEKIQSDTGLVIVETPANPTLAEVSLNDLVEQCGSVPLLVDNTFATPVLQRPLEHGARIVLHSATKFLGGHGDVVGGVVAADEVFARALRRVRVATGALLHPLAGYLLLRGLATLPVRVNRSSATAAVLVEKLSGHRAVGKVCYPSIGGALISFEILGDPQVVVESVRLLTPAVSLGSVDTLIQHPASLTHRVMDADDRASCGISDQLFRVSVGLEEPTDLWSDLDQALTLSIEESR